MALLSAKQTNLENMSEYISISIIYINIYGMRYCQVYEMLSLSVGRTCSVFVYPNHYEDWSILANAIDSGIHLYIYMYIYLFYFVFRCI